MLRFDFTLKHIPGTKIRKADRLSRRPDWKVGIMKIKYLLRTVGYIAYMKW